MDEDDELIVEFLVEAREIVMDVEVTLMNLERVRLQEGRVSNDQLNAAFRGFHTIKGVAGFFSFERMVKTAHEAENMLDLLRSGTLELEADHVTALCESLDLITSAVDNLEATREQGISEEQVAELSQRLRLLSSPDGAGAAAAQAGEPGAGADPAAEVIEAEELLEVEEPIEAGEPQAEASTGEEPPEASPVGPLHGSPPIDEEPGEPVGAAPEPAAEVERVPHVEAGPPKSSAEVAPDSTAATPASSAAPPAPAEAPPVAEPAPAAAPTARPAAAPQGRPSSAKEGGEDKSNQSIRVDLRKLDQLMNLVGELIIAENVLTHEQDETASEPSQQAAQQLDRVTRNLQYLAMSMRMVPIRTLFRKMVRVVRDVSRRQGKQVRVELQGEETEVDKTVVESISDPLMHLIRNAVDHGIEEPERRRAQGKDPTGTITLSAWHESGEVRVTISDDGNGLDTERIRIKAVQQGLVPEDVVLDQAQICDLIFQPGFSTAKVVTNISGRGVGMDVVRRNVESVRGRVDVASEPGQGTAFTLRLPLTLAIIEGMMMRLGRQVFTVPLLAIRESVSVTEYERVLLPSSTELVDLRGQMVPLLPMRELIPYPAAQLETTRPILVVIEDDGNMAGILADELIGQRQVVVKPIPGMLSHISGLTGCSILGNGEISLILDVKFLLSSVHTGGDELASAGAAHLEPGLLEARL